MLPELHEEIDLELAQLRQLLEQFAGLITRSETDSVTDVETLAAAGLLHSFYTGIENIFKRIAVHIDGRPPSGHAWHSQLLRSMAEPTANRPSVIALSLHDRLRDYLSFRHLFRQAYSFQMQWSKMSPLIHNCKGTLDTLEVELQDFLASVQDDK